MELEDYLAEHDDENGNRIDFRDTDDAVSVESLKKSSKETVVFFDPEKGL
jgi:hypothetical protein